MLQMLELVEPLNGANVQEGELKLPPAPPSSQVTVPVGIIFGPVLESTTFAVNVVGSPILTDVGVTKVAVVRGVIVNGTAAILAE